MDDKVFEKWYFDNWPHGETSPLHHAQKKGARDGYQAATEAAEARYKPVVERLVEALERLGQIDFFVAEGSLRKPFHVGNFARKALADAAQLLNKE